MPSERASVPEPWKADCMKIIHCAVWKSYTFIGTSVCTPPVTSSSPLDQITDKLHDVSCSFPQKLHDAPCNFCIFARKSQLFMEELYSTYRLLLDRTPLVFQRFLHRRIHWKSRLVANVALFIVFFFDLDGKLLFNVVEPFLKKHYDDMERKDTLQMPYDMDKYPKYDY